MVTLEIEADPLPFETWDDGSIRVGGTRITFAEIADAYRITGDPAETVESFSMLDAAVVYRCIAYYLAHRDTVDPWLDDLNERAEEALASIERHYPTAKLRAKAEQMMRDADPR